MKKIISIFLCLVTAFSLVGCSSSKKQTALGGIKTTATTTGIHHAVISVKNYGDIYVELNADAAPVTVENFIALAKEGFYDGLTFHRIIDGFMIQGGDPNGDGSGGSETNIKGEFKKNGVNNTISHVRGTISMARTMSSYNSASSQFFIVQSDYTSLDGEYAAFGNVTQGMDIVDKICQDVTTGDENGLVPKSDQPVISSITITD